MEGVPRKPIVDMYVKVDLEKIEATEEEADVEFR